MNEDKLLPSPFSELVDEEVYLIVEQGASLGNGFERWRYRVFSRLGSLSVTLEGTYCVRSELSPEDKRRVVCEVAAEVWNKRDLDWCENLNEVSCRNFICSKCGEAYQKGSGEPNPKFCPECGRPVKDRAC